MILKILSSVLSQKYHVGSKLVKIQFLLLKIIIQAAYFRVFKFRIKIKIKKDYTPIGDITVGTARTLWDSYCRARVDIFKFGDRTSPERGG